MISRRPPSKSKLPRVAAIRSRKDSITRLAAFRAATLRNFRKTATVGLEHAAARSARRLISRIRVNHRANRPARRCQSVEQYLPTCRDRVSPISASHRLAFDSRRVEIRTRRFHGFRGGAWSFGFSLRIGGRASLDSCRFEREKE